MDNKQKVDIDWSVENMQKIRPDLSEEQALDVLENVYNYHDPNVDVCWDTLSFWAESLFPQPEHCYTVEITATLQMYATIDANSPQAAVALVKKTYHDCGYISSLNHLSHISFRVVDDDLVERVGETIGQGRAPHLRELP